MLSLKELRIVAKNIVKNMRIGRKTNPGVEKARKKYGSFIEKILNKKCFGKKGLNEKEIKIIEKLKDPDYGPLIIEKNGKYLVKTKIGETVRLVYSNVDKECIKLAELIKEECWKKGAHVTDLTYSSVESRKHLKLIPFDTAAELPITSKLFAGAYDARIFLGEDEDINWAKGLEEKIKAGSLASQKIREIIDRKKVRWCYFGWPVKKKSSQMFIPYYTYRKIFYSSLKQTFSKETRELCRYYAKSLENGDDVTIIANDGTNLKFSIKGRPILIADGMIDEEDMKRGEVGLNLPDGEVFVAPIENSANGFIIFDWVCIHGFGLIKNLKVKFEKGKIVWFDCPKKKTFQKFLDVNTGEKDRIAELGIGVNKAAAFTGETIVDEKIFGTIHIAIGENRGPYHGKNKASSHQDMIKVMKGKGNLYVDGRIVMKDGFPAFYRNKKSH
ncbi:MAG: aminopeptidase [Candidatus Aenigmatarchaeota archaeon]